MVGPGDLIVLNPEEAHAGGPPAEGFWTYRALYPRPGLMREIMAEFPAGRPTMPHFGRDVVRDQEVTVRLRRFHRLSESPEASMLEREAYLAEALVLLVGRHAAPPQAPGPPGAEPRAVRLSREYLQEHAAENVTSQALARFADLSAFHLCRVFRQAVGMTPHAYQTQVRVRRAKSLLRAGLPITLVAAASTSTAPPPDGSRATSAIGRDVSTTIRAASSRNSGENVLFLPGTRSRPFR